MAAHPRLLVSLLLSLLSASSPGCTGATPRPADLGTDDACAFCRMMVSDPRFAAQIVAPGEEPLFFDDIGCLANRLRTAPRPAGAVAYVADHRTRDWVPASEAVYTRVDALATPMGSHLIAHADAASRDQDSDARGGVNVAVAEILGQAQKGSSNDAL
jgi:copper chaperone NosL